MNRSSFDVIINDGLSYVPSVTPTERNGSQMKTFRELRILTGHTGNGVYNSTRIRAEILYPPVLPTGPVH